MRTMRIETRNIAQRHQGGFFQNENIPNASVIASAVPDQSATSCRMATRIASIKPNTSNNAPQMLQMRLPSMKDLGNANFDTLARFIALAGPKVRSRLSDEAKTTVDDLLLKKPNVSEHAVQKAYGEVLTIRGSYVPYQARGSTLGSEERSEIGKRIRVACILVSGEHDILEAIFGSKSKDASISFLVLGEIAVQLMEKESALTGKMDEAHCAAANVGGMASTSDGTVNVLRWMRLPSSTSIPVWVHEFSHAVHKTKDYAYEDNDVKVLNDQVRLNTAHCYERAISAMFSGETAGELIQKMGKGDSAPTPLRENGGDALSKQPTIGNICATLFNRTDDAYLLLNNGDSWRELAKEDRDLIYSAAYPEVPDEMRSPKCCPSPQQLRIWSALLEERTAFWSEIKEADIQSDKLKSPLKRLAEHFSKFTPGMTPTIAEKIISDVEQPLPTKPNTSAPKPVVSGSP